MSYLKVMNFFHNLFRHISRVHSLPYVFIILSFQALTNLCQGFRVTTNRYSIKCI